MRKQILLHFRKVGRSDGRRKLLTTSAISDLLAVPAGTLRYWRKLGLAPPWVKRERSIRYLAADVEQYIQRNRRIPSVRAAVEEKRVSL